MFFCKPSLPFFWVAIAFIFKAVSHPPSRSAKPPKFLSQVFMLPTYWQLLFFATQLAHSARESRARAWRSAAVCDRKQRRCLGGTQLMLRKTGSPTDNNLLFLNRNITRAKWRHSRTLNEGMKQEKNDVWIVDRSQLKSATKNFELQKRKEDFKE